MVFRNFGLALSARLFVILLTVSATGFLFITPGYPVATLLIGLFAVMMAIELFGFVAKTNREISRFLDAARYADFGQRFEFPNLGAGFFELGETFTFLLDRFRQDRNQHEAQLRQLKAVIEHVPVPLLSIQANGQITLWNNAVRRLFGTTKVTRLEDLAAFGNKLPEYVAAIAPGERMLLTFQIEDSHQSLSVGASEITIAANTQRLISLQNIQSELDIAQLQAWQDLVRVLTHEIMNSITPVSSLAKTAVDLIEDIGKKLPDDGELVSELQDVEDAVNTVARRSDGLMKFVSSYRQLTRLPEPEMERFPVTGLFFDVQKIVTADWSNSGPQIKINITPVELDLTADRQMIEQVLINLLQNAYHAVVNVTGAVIELRAKLNQRGQVTLEVLDNGPGIDPDVAERIFVPFYTTRKQGSGVGLALSRQIMIANGGTIAFANREEGGARFVLVFS